MRKHISATNVARPATWAAGLNPYVWRPEDVPLSQLARLKRKERATENIRGPNLPRPPQLATSSSSLFAIDLKMICLQCSSRPDGMLRPRLEKRCKFQCDVPSSGTKQGPIIRSSFS